MNPNAGLQFLFMNLSQSSEIIKAVINNQQSTELACNQGDYTSTISAPNFSDSVGIISSVRSS